MEYNERPSQPIFNDAYSIADAIAHQQNQEARLAKAIARLGILSDTVTRLSNDIVRLDVLIRTRIQAWETDYGTVQSWKKYVINHPQAKKVIG